MAELTITAQEKERVALFIQEQKEEWDAKERRVMYDERAKGREYEPREFPGFDEATALQAVRNGWRSKLDLAFDKKRKREGW